MDETQGSRMTQKTRQCRTPGCMNVFSIEGRGKAKKLDCEECVILRRRAASRNQGKSRRVASKCSSSEARAAYQRRYYQMHKEKAKEYQRQYNLTHKKKARGSVSGKLNRGRSGEKAFKMPRPAITESFSRAGLTRLQPEKFARMVNKITKGERLLTP